MQAQLALLLEEEAYVRERVRVLRTLIAGLTAVQRPQLGGEDRKRVAPSVGHDCRTPEHLGTAKLRRACRIALMESSHPEDARRILERIRRRGSLSFDGSGDPLTLVACELMILATEGEAHRLIFGGTEYWELLRE